MGKTMKITPGIKVCITGAAGGIGRATALAFARRGAHLFLMDIQAEALEETCALAREAGGTVALSAVFDISKLDEVQAFADAIHKDSGPLDILVNNAGIALFGQVQDMVHEDWKRIIDVDLWGPIHGIECFVPTMIRARRGHIVTVSSTAGLVGLPWHGAYSTAKFGLVGLSEVLRYDLAQHNVGVTVVCPGAVKTPIRDAVRILKVDRESPDAQRLMARFERHALEPEQVADMIVRAVEKEKFLVITSADIKLLYFFKHHCFPIYHFILGKLSGMMNALRNERA